MAEVKLPNVEPNSKTYRKAREKLQPVIRKDDVISTKKPISRKLADKFLETDIQEAKEYFFRDILVPGIKDAALDIISMLLTGEGYSSNRRRGGYSNYSNYGRSSYRGSSSRDRARRGRDYDRESCYERDDKVSYRDIVVRDRSDAEEIVDKLHDRIQDRGDATVAELLELVDIPSAYTDNNYGWTRCSEINLRRVNGGWLIDVDEARYLN